MNTPADDLITGISNANLGWIPGTNLFASDVLPVYQTDQTVTGPPSASVFVSIAGGYATPTRYEQGTYVSAGPGVQAREPRVMIYVRSPRLDYYTGLVSARAIRDAIHDVPLQIGTTGAYYDAVRIVDAEPMLLAVTDSGESLFSMNCHLYLDA